MAGNQVTLTFAGDSAAAERATSRVGQAVETTGNEVGQAGQRMASQMGSTEQAFDSLNRSSGRLGEGLDVASGAFSQLSGGIGDIGGAMTAFTDLQDAAASAADRQAQAQINVEKAQKALADATKEFGADSIEAREAQLSLNQAQRDAEPPSKIQEWGEKMELISPIIMGVVGATDLLMLANTALSSGMVVNTAKTVGSTIATGAQTVATGVATAAQWAFNAAIAFATSPITLVVLAIAALVAGIVWVATQTTWFQDSWHATWNAVASVFNWAKDGIGSGIRAVTDWLTGLWNRISDTPGRIGSAFGGIANIVSAPFKAGFNAIARAWNATVGKLSWTIPDWVPQYGGNSISAPHLPTFHTGGRIPGAPGTEVVARLMAGETITPAGQSSITQIVLRGDGSRVGDLLIEVLRSAMEIRGNDIQVVTASAI